MTHHEDAQRIQRTFQNAVASIRADRNLSDAGREARLTELYKQAVVQMSAVQEAHTAEVENELETARKAVFGLSFTRGASGAERAAAQSLYRDALDRTTALKTEQDGLDMLESAFLTSDSSLLKAAALSAYRNGWHKVLTRYAELEPDGAQRISELRDLESANRDPLVRLGASMSFNLSRPQEVDQNAAVDAVAASKIAAAGDA